MSLPEEMGFKFIQHIQQKESRSHNLTKLPADFFDGLAAHIERLQSLVREEMARDPMSTTANLVQNELRNTVMLAQDIVLLRLRKMANRAVDSLEGGKVDLRSLTPKEKDLYGELARFMSDARTQLAPPGGGTSAAAASPAPRAAPMEVPPSTEAKPQEDTGPPDVAVAETGEDEGRAVVHVLKDTPPFAGEGGRTYSLKKGDMVTLPRQIADVLLSRGMVEVVEE
jgi:DNA replication factor GINS